MAGKGEGAVPGPAVSTAGVPGALPAQSGGVTEALQAQARLADFLRRQAGFTHSPYYAGSPLTGYGGPALPPLPPTRQYGAGGLAPSGANPQQPGGGQPMFDPRFILDLLGNPPLGGNVPPPPQPSEQPRPQPTPFDNDSRFQAIDWSKLQAVNPGNVRPVTIDGRDAVRYVLGQEDFHAATNGTRIEHLNATTQRVGEGAQRTYRWSTYFPEDYPITDKWQVVGQWHSDDFDNFGVSTHGSSLDFDVPGTGTRINLPLQKNRWYDIEARIIWSTDPSKGRIEWIVDGQTILSRAARTMAPGEGQYYPKQGYYRSRDIPGTGSIIHTPMRVYNGIG